MLLMFPSFFPSKADILYSIHVYLVLQTSQRVNAHFYPTLKKMLVSSSRHFVFGQQYFTKEFYSTRIWLITLYLSKFFFMNYYVPPFQLPNSENFPSHV